MPATLESLGPTRAYRMRDGSHVHARCADSFALRLGGPAGFAARVASYHTESVKGEVRGACAYCKRPVRGMLRTSLRGVQIERVA